MRARPKDAWLMESWREDAECLKHPELDFFCENGTKPIDCKRVCYSCPVRLECLAWAVEHHETEGVYGGLGPKERKGLTLTVWSPDPLPAGPTRRRTG